MSDFIQWTYENKLQISIDLAAGSISGMYLTINYS